MESSVKRHIRSNKEIQHLFTPALGKDTLVKRGATLEDTMRLLEEKIPETLNETKALAKRLQDKDVLSSCRNVFNFVMTYVAYEKDQEGKEQVKSPGRTLSDQKGDCEDMAGLIYSLLLNMGIKPTYRTAKYWYQPTRFTHIYPVLLVNNGQIVMDCVVGRFNTEEPYTEIKDWGMDLYYLSGIERPSSVDYSDLTNDGFDDLGKLKILQKVKETVKKVEQKVAPVIQKVGTAVKTGLNAINKVNPATALLRLGVLGSMKLNVFGVAEKLRFAYLSEDEAKTRGFNMSKFEKLKKTLSKIEGTFYAAGGKPENLKEAILTGKGNASHEVSGLGDIAYQLPLNQVIGQRLYSSEVSGLGELGEPITASALAAASTFMATIAAIVKGIGNLKDGQAQTGPASVTPLVYPGITNAPAPDPSFDDSNSNLNIPDIADDTPVVDNTTDPAVNPMDRTTPVKTVDSNAPGTTPNTQATNPDPGTNVTKSTGTGTNGNTTPTDEKWYQKKWVKPTAITVGALGLAYAGYKIFGKGKKGKGKPKQEEALSGVPKHKHKNKKYKKNKRNKNKNKNRNKRRRINPSNWDY